MPDQALSHDSEPSVVREVLQRDTAKIERETAKIERDIAKIERDTTKLEGDAREISLSLAETKLQREIAKIEEETRDIRLRRAEQRSLNESVKRWVGMFLPFLSVISGSVAIFASISSLENGIIAQQRRQLEFAVSREFIELTKQLQSGAESERASAALLLVYYEEFAVPVLIESIENPVVDIRAITESLRRIMSPDLTARRGSILAAVLRDPADDRRASRDVLPPLRARVQRALDEARSPGVEPRIIRIAERYVTVLGALAAGRCDKQSIDALAEARTLHTSNDSPEAIALTDAIAEASSLTACSAA